MKILFVIDTHGYISWGLSKIISDEEISTYSPQQSEVVEQLPIDRVLHNPKWDRERLMWVDGEPQMLTPTFYADYDKEEGTIIGFYNTDAHSNIPETAVNISKGMWEYLLNNQCKYFFNVPLIEQRIAETRSDVENVDHFKSDLVKEVKEYETSISTLKGVINDLTNELHSLTPPEEAQEQKEIELIEEHEEVIENTESDIADKEGEDFE